MTLRATLIPGYGRACSFLFSIFLLFAFPSAPSARGAAAGKDTVQEPHRIPEDTGPVFREVRSVPYPNGALYMNRGISGAFMGGKHRNFGESQSLYQWQGELGYFYTPYFSGGAGFKITAGEPSDSAQKIFNRYFLNMRLHHAWSDAAMYVGAQLGMGNLNILTGSPKDTQIKTPIKNTKPTLGLDLGGGWKCTRYLGLTLGSNLEYSLVDEEGVGTTNALNLHINPGVSLDILAFTDTLRELVPAMYVYVEYQRGLLIFEKGDNKQDQATVLGVGLAF
ncbi:MAG: hypothetical protein JWP91_1774 [Fibrobacteres bacterium]|nr:hypothetical protein [Fibrobacterota bacterium]